MLPIFFYQCFFTAENACYLCAMSSITQIPNFLLMSQLKVSKLVTLGILVDFTKINTPETVLSGFNEENRYSQKNLNPFHGNYLDIRH